MHVVETVALKAAAFSLPAAQAFDEAAIEKKLFGALSWMTWDDFVDDDPMM